MPQVSRLFVLSLFTAGKDGFTVYAIWCDPHLIGLKGSSPCFPFLFLFKSFPWKFTSHSLCVSKIWKQGDDQAASKIQGV